MMAGKTVRVCIPDRPEVKALLADIKDHPDDVGLRLILADWLEDHDDPRGTFLRFQCYGSDAGCAPPGTVSERWEMEAEALLQQHAPLWLGQLREHLDGWEFRRGLLRIKLKAARLPPGDDSQPRQDSVLGGLGRSLWQMFQLMTGSAESLTHDALLKLAETETWAWVETLAVQSLDVNQLPALLASPLLRTIHSLDLTSTGLGNFGTTILASSPRLSHLRELRLSFNSIGPQGFLALAGSPHLAGLQDLTLDYNRGEDEGAVALALSPHLRNLQRLHLNDNQIGSEGAAALAASPNLAKVRSLALSHNPIGPEGASGLAASPYLDNLVLLMMMDTFVGSDGRALLRSRFGDSVIGVSENEEEDIPYEDDPTV